MLPEAILSHDAYGRTRWRIAEMRCNLKFFEKLEKSLSECPGVTHLQTDARTGSLLVIHEGNAPAIAKYAFKHHLFQQPAKRGKLQRKPMESLIPRRVSNRATAIGLFGLGLFQLLRGNVLGPTSTLWAEAAKWAEKPD